MKELGFPIILQVVGVLVSAVQPDTEVGWIQDDRHALVHRGDRRARIVARLQANPDLFLATVQVGVSLMTASSIGDPERTTAMRWRLVRRGLLLYGIGLAFDMIWAGTIPRAASRSS